MLKASLHSLIIFAALLGGSLPAISDDLTAKANELLAQALGCQTPEGDAEVGTVIDTNQSAGDADVYRLVNTYEHLDGEDAEREVDVFIYSARYSQLSPPTLKDGIVTLTCKRNTLCIARREVSETACQADAQGNQTCTPHPLLKNPAADSTSSTIVDDVCKSEVKNAMLALSVLIKQAASNPDSADDVVSAGIRTTLNVRASPGPNANVIADIPAASGPFPVSDCQAGDGGDWCKVDWVAKRAGCRAATSNPRNRPARLSDWTDETGDENTFTVDGLLLRCLGLLGGRDRQWPGILGGG